MREKPPVQDTKLRTKSIDKSLLAIERLNSFESILHDKFITQLNAQNLPDPGGCYSGGVWCRDASYILEAMTQTDFAAVAEDWLEFVWANIISESSKNIILGRGSPVNGLRQRAATKDELLTFAGALPTTINSTHSEIYAGEPDIDSTALMVHATERVYQKTRDKDFLQKIMPSIDSAMEYLESRDCDGDFLLEQGPNEDWMDVICRSGKVAYSQATWIQALKSYSIMLASVGLESLAEDVAKKAAKVARRVNEIMWDEELGSFNDILTNCSTPKSLTQDICSLFTLENIDNAKKLRSLATIRSRLSRPFGRAVLDPVVNRREPIRIEEYHYQNGGIWPWVTAMECIALSKLSMHDEMIELISEVIPFVHYEWVNPMTCEGSGASPFKTGIAALYLACKSVPPIDL